MVNLMAVDANRLQQVPNLTTVFWSMPLLSIISIVLLYTVMGPSALVVLAMLLIIIPINGVFIANMIRKLQVGASLGHAQLIFCCHYMLLPARTLPAETESVVSGVCSESKCK